MESSNGDSERPLADLSAEAQVQPSVVKPPDRSTAAPSGKRLAVRPTSLFSVARSQCARNSSNSNQYNNLDKTNNLPASLDLEQATNNMRDTHHIQSINTTTSSSQLTGASLQTTSAADLSGSQHQPQDPQNPYPLYAPITFFYLNQTARPRSWCLAIVSNKYPNHRSHTHNHSIGRSITLDWAGRSIRASE